MCNGYTRKVFKKIKWLLFFAPASPNRPAASSPTPSTIHDRSILIIQKRFSPQQLKFTFHFFLHFLQITNAFNPPIGSNKLNRRSKNRTAASFSRTLTPTPSFSSMNLGTKKRGVTFSILPTVDRTSLSTLAVINVL